MKKTPVKKILPALLLLCALLLPSCAQKDTPNPSTTTLRMQGETEVLPDGRAYYVEDANKYALSDAVNYFVWRNEGNPDFFENATVYDPADPDDGLSFFLQSTYSLQDKTWGFRVQSSDGKIRFGPWSHLINLEKWEDGTWVRQGVLWDPSIYSISSMDYATKGFELGIDPAILNVSPCPIDLTTIYPEPTVGKYRFVYFVSVKANHRVEERRYYIPFEVVE